MKNTLFFLALFCSATLSAQWAVDKGHSKVAFIVKHHTISEVDGYFKKYEATLVSSKDDLSDAVFEMTVETASINTDLEMRDNHLRSEDIFNVEKYPTMTFKSTSFKKKKGNKYKMTGDLTLRGVTKPLELDVVMNGPIPNPNTRMNNKQIGIKATGSIKRSDFNLGQKLPFFFVEDVIQIRVTGEFNKPN